jgi:NAD(P)-dependent dehydrogenase (short-subunit alcohol dehydrogenase family)
MNTILITGCSSGFGLETARYFLDRGWTVIATMRTPREDILPPSDRLRILPLDVTNAKSIAHVVETAGPIDVLVNNAGVGLLNALEGVSIGMVREVFETNTFGTMAMTKAVVPQFREQRAGVVINVTSTVTLRPLHLLSIYTASKAAVNAFTESLALELEPFGVRARFSPAWGWISPSHMPIWQRRYLPDCSSQARKSPGRWMWRQRYGGRRQILLAQRACPQGRTPWRRPKRPELGILGIRIAPERSASGLAISGISSPRATTMRGSNAVLVRSGDLP